jgi:Ca2+-binding EF-hand superfamily protein
MRVFLLLQPSGKLLLEKYGLKKMFLRYDFDQDGTFSKAELRKCLGTLGVKLSRGDFEELVNAFAYNAEGAQAHLDKEKDLLQQKKAKCDKEERKRPMSEEARNTLMNQEERERLNQLMEGESRQKKVLKLEAAAKTSKGTKEERAQLLKAASDEKEELINFYGIKITELVEFFEILAAGRIASQSIPIPPDPPNADVSRRQGDVYGQDFRTLQKAHAEHEKRVHMHDNCPFISNCFELMRAGIRQKLQGTFWEGTAPQLDQHMPKQPTEGPKKPHTRLLDFFRMFDADGSGALGLHEVKLMIYTIASDENAGEKLRQIYARFYNNPLVLVKQNFEEGEKGHSHQGKRGRLLKFADAIQTGTEYEVKLFDENIKDDTCSYRIQMVRP